MYDHEYPPGELTADEIASLLADTPESFPVPAFHETDRWEELRSDPRVRDLRDEVVEAAETARESDMPTLPATRFLEWNREGTRSYLDRLRERSSRLDTFLLAECLERDGRFLDAVLDYAWATCEQASWSYPPNLSEEEDLEGLPVDRPPGERSVDLRSTSTAFRLAELDYVLGDRLHPALRRRIRTEVDRRVLRPYEARDDFWWMDPPTNNWNAACNGRTLLAALYLEDDVERLAELLETGLHSLEHYLQGFDGDGCTPEGIGYWNYGFGNYVQFAAHLEARTDGGISLLSVPIVEEIARFPMRIALSPGRYPAFSDGQEATSLRPDVACWLGCRLDIPWLRERGTGRIEESGGRNAAERLRQLVWCRSPGTNGRPAAPPKRYFAAGHQWWVVRFDPQEPAGLTLAAKGGHNDEPHNHNDCGSFVLHVHDESLLTDLGAPNYEQYFEEKYRTLPARSLGHSVPYVNGYEQSAGAEYAASVVDRTGTPDRETLTLELADCYPGAAGLESLRRRFLLDRTEPPGRVTVADRATFAPDAPARDLESVLVSYYPIETRRDGLLVRGDHGDLAVSIDGEHQPATTERLEGEVDKSGQAGFEEPDPDVWRARIPATGSVELELDPVADGA